MDPLFISWENFIETKTGLSKISSYLKIVGLDGFLCDPQYIFYSITMIVHPRPLTRMSEPRELWIFCHSNR